MPAPRPWAVARRAALHGLVIGGLVFLVYTFVDRGAAIGTVGFDAWAYWSVQLPHPYEVAVGSLGAFTYSPPMAMLFHLVSGLQWWVFLWIWLAVLLATAIWLGGRRALIVLAFPPVIMELYHGNVNLLIGAAIVLGFRHPWTWSFVLLTKPTCGVGLLWFAVRREWRQLGIALGTTAAIVAVSFVIAPQMWQEWIELPHDQRVGHARRRLGAHPAVAAVRRGGGHRGLGRPHRPDLDGARRQRHRAARAVVRGLRHPRRAGASAAGVTAARSRGAASEPLCRPRKRCLPEPGRCPGIGCRLPCSRCLTTPSRA